MFHFRLYAGLLLAFLAATPAAAGPIAAPAALAVIATAEVALASTEVALPRNDLAGLGNFAKVSDQLYRGRQPEAEGFKTLKRLGIKTVVSLRAFHSDRSMLAGTGLGYRRISFNTWHPEDEDVILFLKIAGDKKNWPVFVHCQHGADRTGMMVALYRMYYQDWTKEQALAELPGFGFHEVWAGIRDFIDKVDLEKIRKRVDAAGPPTIDIVP